MSTLPSIPESSDATAVDGVEQKQHQQGATNNTRATPQLSESETMRRTLDPMQSLLMHLGSVARSFDRRFEVRASKAGKESPGVFLIMLELHRLPPPASHAVLKQAIGLSWFNLLTGAAETDRLVSFHCGYMKALDLVFSREEAAEAEEQRAKQASAPADATPQDVSMPPLQVEAVAQASDAPTAVAAAPVSV